MGTEVRDFLAFEKSPIVDMSEADLRSECGTWRLVYNMLPREVETWLSRMYDVVRFTRRNYQGSVGILLGFKMEATEYTIGLTESAFDVLRGKRIVEDKLLVIPASAIMYHEFIGETRDYDPSLEESAIAAQEIG